MKRSAENILASYIDALHPIIYINHFDFKVIDAAIAHVGARDIIGSTKKNYDN